MKRETSRHLHQFRTKASAALVHGAIPPCRSRSLKYGVIETCASTSAAASRHEHPKAFRPDGLSHNALLQPQRVHVT